MKQDIIRKQKEEKEQAQNKTPIAEFPTKIEIIIPTEFKDPIPVRSPKSVPIPPIKEIDDNDYPMKSVLSKIERDNDFEMNKTPIIATIDKIKINHTKKSNDELPNSEKKNDEKMKISKMPQHQYEIKNNNDLKTKKKYDSDSDDDDNNNYDNNNDDDDDKGLRARFKDAGSIQNDNKFKKNVTETAENKKCFPTHQKDNSSEKNRNDPMIDKINDCNNKNEIHNNNNNNNNNADDDDRNNNNNNDNHNRRFSNNYSSNDSNDSSEKHESSLNIDIEVEELSPRRQSVLSPKIQEFQMLSSPVKKKSSLINRISKKIMKTVGKVGGGSGGASSTERTNIPPQSPSAMVNTFNYNYSNDLSSKNDTNSHQSSNDDHDEYENRKKKEKKDKEDKRKLQEMRGKQDVQKSNEKDIRKKSLHSTIQGDGKANDANDGKKSIIRSQSENIMGTNDDNGSSDSD